MCLKVSHKIKINAYYYYAYHCEFNKRVRGEKCDFCTKIVYWSKFRAETHWKGDDKSYSLIPMTYVDLLLV